MLVSLANGLDYQANGSLSSTLDYYNEALSISNYARSPIAAATESRLVVNYPNVRSLDPTRNATRAEVAALIYQALVDQGQAPVISSQYIASPKVATNPNDSTNSTSFRIPGGATIPVSYNKEKILLSKDETVPVRLEVAANITTADERVLIPAGSQVVGKLQPAEGGTQFIAQSLVLPSGKTQPISATSQVITETETVRKGMDVGKIAQNAALGAAAAAAIAAVTGDNEIATEEVLIGAGAGVVGSLIDRFVGRNSVELLVVRPDTDLDLTLREDLVIRAQQ